MLWCLLLCNRDLKGLYLQTFALVKNQDCFTNNQTQDQLRFVQYTTPFRSLWYSREVMSGNFETSPSDKNFFKGAMEVSLLA